MRMLLEIFAQTLRTLWSHKLRSFLTMFGIAWGVGSLLLLVGLGEGFRSGQQKQMATMGENPMFISEGQVPAVEGSRTGSRRYYLTYQDYEDIHREANLVRNISPMMGRGDIRLQSEFQNSNGQVQGMLPAFGRI